MRSAATAAAPVRVAETLERAREHLLSLQDEAGWWKGELQTNVTMDAEDLLLREFFRNVEYVVLPDVGHLPYEEAPGEFNRHVLFYYPASG